MIYINETDLKKIQLIDRILSNVPIEELNSLLEKEKIIGKLKGNDTVTAPGAIESIIQDNNRLGMELSQLKADFIQLLRVVNKTVTTDNHPMLTLYDDGDIYNKAKTVTHNLKLMSHESEFMYLKNRHGIY
jgi:hypothetical protein